MLSDLPHFSLFLLTPHLVSIWRPALRWNLDVSPGDAGEQQLELRESTESSESEQRSNFIIFRSLLSELLELSRFLLTPRLVSIWRPALRWNLDISPGDAGKQHLELRESTESSQSEQRSNLIFFRSLLSELLEFSRFLLTPVSSQSDNLHLGETWTYLQVMLENNSLSWENPLNYQNQSRGLILSFSILCSLNCWNSPFFF